MISESERKNHLGHITVEAATAATAAAAATATAASTEVGLFSLLCARDDAEIVWRSASSCGFFVTERWVDACVACLTHITHTQRVTLVSACLPDCLSAWHRLSLVTYVSRARVPESRPHSHRRSPTALSMCGVTWRRVGCIFRWYYVIVSHGAAALSFTVCATASAQSLPQLLLLLLPLLPLCRAKSRDAAAAAASATAVGNPVLVYG